MTQMFCFLWMETLGLHSQDGYGLMGPPWEQVMRLTYYRLTPEPDTVDMPLSDL